MKRTSPLLWITLALTGCGTTNHATNEFAQPNSLMSKEIDSRIEQIPYQHREELYNNLLWLAQRGEQAIPALLRCLGNHEPKMRSSAAWVLGRIGDRRTIENLQRVSNDPHETVRLEVARSLVEMGDVRQCPTLITALDSDKVQIRAMCHDTLKSATGKDFGYDHLTDNVDQRKQAVLRWRLWWGAQSNDPWFAQQYAQQNQIAVPGAAPAGETHLQSREESKAAAPVETQEAPKPAEVQEAPKGETKGEPKVEIPR